MPDSELLVIITVASAVLSLVWTLLRITKFFDAIIGGGFDVFLHRDRYLVDLHIFNKGDRPVQLYGVFLYRSENDRLSLCHNMPLSPSQDIPIRFSLSDIAVYVQDSTKIIRKDRFHPVKILLDTSRGCYYSEWIDVGAVDSDISLKGYSGRSRFILRRRPSKMKVDASFMIVAIIEFILLASSFDQPDKGAFILCLGILFISNMILGSFHASYGYGRWYYNLIGSVILVAPLSVLMMMPEAYPELVVLLTVGYIFLFLLLL